MNIFLFLLLRSAKLPNTHLIRIFVPAIICVRISDPRPFSSNLMRNVSFLSSCLTIEYCLVNSHSLSVHTNEANCHALAMNISLISTINSMVVGLRNFLDINVALDVCCSCHSIYGTKSLLVTPHTGHLQSSGISVNSVPGDMPLSSSQRTGS